MKRLIKKIATKMSTITDDYLDEGGPNWKPKRTDVTRWLDGTINIDYIKNLPGAEGEIREWHEYNGKKYFGNYTEEEWNEFLEDIKQNGIKYKIMIFIEADGKIVIAEGNHRIQACLQLGIKDIPVEIRFFANSQKFVKYFDE